jgi:ABC-type branched-subunit amino acid transport system substrate-binding protein
MGKIAYTWIALLLLSPIDVNAGGRVGFGSSDAVLPKKDQEWFYSGFEIGLEVKGPKNALRDLVIKRQVADGSPLGASLAAANLESEGAIALVGFPTSHEALLAAKVAVENQLVGLFIGASHERLSKLGSFVFSTGPSAGTIAQSMLKFARKRYPRGNGLLISNPSAVFSMGMEDALVGIGDRQLFPVRLNKDLLLNHDVIKDLRSGRYDFLVVTPYASESQKLMEQLEDAGVDLPIVATPTWITEEIEYIKRFILKRKTPIFGPRDWVSGSKESKGFESAFVRKHKTPPRFEIAYGFDLGIIVGDVLSRMGPPYTRERFRSFFLARRCYEDTSSGTICFPASGGHAIRNLYILQVRPDGFSVVNSRNE